MSADARMIVTYRVASDPSRIEAKAYAIAIEQSLELSLDAVDAPHVREIYAGRVEHIGEPEGGVFPVKISLAAETAGGEAGQLINMLFGNSSLQDDVVLDDVELPAAMVAEFGGPATGAAAMRERASATGRAMTSTAIKPQGLDVAALAQLTGRLALGGIDIIKDDHGLADQRYSPFAPRVAACAAAVREAARQTGITTRYAPHVSGDLDRLRRQLRLVDAEGIDTVLISPMLIGLPAFHTVTREFPRVAFIAHPAMGGAARIAPPLLIGRLFRLLGAAAVIFPHFGGRFGYSLDTCKRIGDAARGAWGIEAAMPVPAGGMTLDRIPEILDVYGPDSMLLIGGGLLAARERLTEEAARFVERVSGHRYGEN
jgi:ribulose-bisphosphate carboxylase large chain